VRTESPQSEERRRFFETAGTFGVTAAFVAGAAAALTSSEAAARTAKTSTTIGTA
jgi:hypothetical protein